MRLLPTSDQITDDLNDLKLRIAKMNARRNAQINLLQRKVMGGSLRSKYYPWSREYYRRLYNTYPHLYPFSAYPWRSSSLDSLELDKYYDSLNLDNKLYTYDLDDSLYSKYKRIARTNPPNTDLLSKLKDFVFEQERQMTTDLLRKISEDKKIRSTDRPNVYSRSKSPSRYDTPLKNDPPFLNPINKKDNFYKRYNAFIKKILKPLRKTSPVKYELPKTPRTPKATSLSPTKPNYLSRSYLDDYYYYPSQFYNPYWYRYSSYPYYRRYLYDYDYLPKLQPASVPLDVESIIRKSNIEDRNYKPLKKTYIPPTTYKYDPFESDSYLRSSLPTWKQYYYTQKLRSKPSNECFLDYYDPYYDFFPDRASVDSTDDLLSNEGALPELSDDPNQLVDEYRDAIYEDIIQNLREKQSKRNKDMPLRADRKLFGYRVDDRVPGSYFSSEPYSNLYRPTYAPSVYKTAGSYSQKFPTYNYYPKDTPPKPTYCRANFEQNDAKDHLKDSKESKIPKKANDAERNNFSQDYHKTKLDDSEVLPSDTQTRKNVVSPSFFHRKCTTPVDDSFDEFSVGNLSPSKTKTWNVDGKLSPRNDDASDHKLERYRSSNTLNKIKSSPLYDENKQKYDTEPKRISDYKPNTSSVDEYKADNSSQYKPDSFSQYKSDSFSQYKPDTATSQYKPDTSTSQYKPDKPDAGGQYTDDIYAGQYKVDTGKYKPDTSTSQYKPDKPDAGDQYTDDIYAGQYKADVGQYKPDTSTSQYKPFISQYKPDKPDADGQYTDDIYAGQYKVDTGQYKPDASISQYKADTTFTNEYKPDTSPTRFGFTKPENPSNEYQSFSTVQQTSDKFTPLNSPTKLKPSTELNRSNYPPANESSSDTFTPINSPPKPRSQLRRPSNYPSESEFIKTLNSVPSERKNSLTDKRRESLTNETLPESRIQRLTSTNFGAGNCEPSDFSKYSSDAPQRQTSPTAKKQTRLSETGWQEDRLEPRGENSDSAAENLRRSSSTRSRQPTPTERFTLSRRNSVVFDPNKLSTNQTASRKNSIKPLQRRNSIQPASEKRNVLQKMNNETKYDGDEQPPVSNENSAESYSIEKQAEEVPFRSLTQFQKKLSKEEVFSGVDELARKNMDSKHNTYIGDDHRPANQYDLSPEESNTDFLKTSAPLPETNYYDENPSSYEENSKDSYGRDTYTAKEQQFYPQYNYKDDTKYDSSIPQASFSEQIYQADTNSSLDGNQKSHTQVESGSNNCSGDYNQSAAPDVSDEKAKSQDQPRLGHSDSYGDQEPSLVSQSSSDSRSRRSFQQSDENADASLSLHESPVRSYEPKEPELSLNAINEEMEKADDKPKRTDGTNVQPTSAESTTAAPASTIPKRSVDYGKSTIPRELSRRPSRSALLSQSSDDKKLKNQTSAGELQKRMSKPKIAESKLRRTTSTLKVRPAGPAKKT